MSFKHWIASMSGFEMTFLLIGLAISLIFVIAIFFLLEGPLDNLNLQGIF